MPSDETNAGLFVAIHFTVIGAIAWATGEPFLFPSLGPSAYLLAAGEKDRAAGPYHVIGGHAIATVCGLIAYHTIAPGIVVVDALDGAARSPELLRLGVSSLVAMVLTTLGMLWSDTNHPAACATTLIVSLGLLSTLVEAVYIVAAVTLLVAVHEFVVSPIADRLDVRPEDPR